MIPRADLPAHVAALVPATPLAPENVSAIARFNEPSGGTSLAPWLLRRPWTVAGIFMAIGEWVLRLGARVRHWHPGDCWRRWRRVIARLRDPRRRALREATRALRDG